MRIREFVVVVAISTVGLSVPLEARECALDRVSFEVDFQAYLSQVHDLATEVDRKGLPEGISLRGLATEADLAAQSLSAEQEDALCAFFSTHTSIRQAPRNLTYSLRRLPETYDVTAEGRAQAETASGSGQSCLGEQGRAAVDLTNKAADLAGIVAQAICDAVPSGDFVVVNAVLCPIAGVLKGVAKVAEFVGKVDDICQLFKTTFNLNRMEEKTDEGFIDMGLRFDDMDDQFAIMARQISVDSLAIQVEDVDSDVAAVDLDLEAVSSDLDQQKSNRQEFQELNVRISIEQQLGSDQNDRISLFQLPEAFGGKLEEVREVVAAAILMNVDAGQDIGQALTFFTDGDTHFNNQDYSDAFASYRQAYREAAQAGAQPGMGQKK